MANLFRHALLAGVILLSSAPAALAGGGAAKKADSSASHLDLAPMGLPVISGGRIQNYIFVQARLMAAPGADLTKLREKEPYYRDALVRAAYRTPFTKDGDWTVLDETRVEAVLLAEARRLGGPKSFTSAQVLKQTPRRRTGVRQAH